MANAREKTSSPARFTTGLRTYSSSFSSEERTTELPGPTTLEDAVDVEHPDSGWIPWGTQGWRPRKLTVPKTRPPDCLERGPPSRRRTRQLFSSIGRPFRVSTRGSRHHAWHPMRPTSSRLSVWASLTSQDRGAVFQNWSTILVLDAGITATRPAPDQTDIVAAERTPAAVDGREEVVAV